MATTFSFKDIIDLPDWRPLAVAPNASAAGGALACDLRTTEDRDPRIFQLASASALNDYSSKNDGWGLVVNPVLTGTFGAGATAVMAPQRGPRGTLAAGSTPTSVVLSTALPGSVGLNQLANRGDGTKGYKIRIIGNSAGSSGKVEERYIVANTSGTTPTLTLDSPLSFTPALGDAYEILSGRVYMLSAGVLAAGSWKAYDIATNTVLANLSITNLPATVNTDSSMVVLDELYCPNTPGQGFLLGSGTNSALTATASGATSLTGQAAGGDAGVVANEYRNFQIRIVQDTITPTAVGQRRKITSHTGGPSPVYTVPAWTVTPSATAQYVIENTNEMLLWTTAQTNTYTYAQDAISGGQAADTWSTATYAARGAAMGAGCMSFQPFSIALDTSKNRRYSHVFSFRGGNVASLDLFDLAGAATGSWSSAVAYGGRGPLFTTGSCLTYDSCAGYAYINQNGGQTFFRFDAHDGVLERWAQLRFAQGTAVVGSRMASCLFVDVSGSPKMCFPTVLRSSGTEMFQTAGQR